jgi:16S rRNA (uracil1498-N3)-methyltransferase
MNLFYIPDIPDGEAFLSEEESAHIVRVLRLREGDPVLLTDGKGSMADGVIVDIRSRKCRISIMKIIKEEADRTWRLHLAVAPTKNSDRMEWLMEKATETGLDEFTPLLCRHSERKQIQISRLQKVAVSAMKQSVKAWLPVIRDMIPFEAFVAQTFSGKKFIAHCRSGDKRHLFNCIAPGEKVLVLIGPEGDFSPEEITLAIRNGYQEITLGNSRLRTETAALTACLTVAVKNEAQTTSDPIFAK